MESKEKITLCFYSVSVPILLLSSEKKQLFFVFHSVKHGHFFIPIRGARTTEH